MTTVLDKNGHQIDERIYAPQYLEGCHDRQPLVHKLEPELNPCLHLEAWAVPLATRYGTLYLGA